MDIHLVRDRLRATVGPDYVPAREAAFAIMETYLPELLAAFDAWIPPALQRELQIVYSVGSFSGCYACFSEKQGEMIERLQKERYGLEHELYALTQEGEEENVRAALKTHKDFLQKRYGREISSFADLELLVGAADCKRKMLDCYERAKDGLSFIEDITNREGDGEQKKGDAHLAKIWKQHEVSPHIDSSIAFFLEIAHLLYDYAEVIHARNCTREERHEYEIRRAKKLYMDFPHNAFPLFSHPAYEFRQLSYFDDVYRRAQQRLLSFEEALYIYDSDGLGWGLANVIDMPTIREKMNDEKTGLANQWRESIPDSIREIVHHAIKENYRLNPKQPEIVAFLEKAAPYFAETCQRDGRKIRRDGDRHIASVIFLMTRKQYYDQHSEVGKDCTAVLADLRNVGYP